MNSSILMMAILVQGGQTADTVALSAGEAVALALEAAPAIESAALRLESSRQSARQSEAWTNPSLVVSADNLGRIQETTGGSGISGVEGQAVLTFGLPLGGQRSSRIALGRAGVVTSEFEQLVAHADVEYALTRAVSVEERDRRIWEYAAGAARTMVGLADQLRLQAAEGRTSDGEAARARLAAVTATSVARQREAEWVRSRSELNRWLGLSPQTVVSIEMPICVAPDQGLAEDPPDLRAAEARVSAADAATRVASSSRSREVQPLVGLRRVQRTTALYLGIGLNLAVFDRKGGSIASAESDRGVAAQELRLARSVIEARRVGALDALAALDAAGRSFTVEWVEALDRTREAAQVRYEAGEGTLIELLDGQRAAFDAQAEFERWKAEWRIARAEVQRLSGDPTGNGSLCDPSMGEA